MKYNSPPPPPRTHGVEVAVGAVVAVVDVIFTRIGRSGSDAGMFPLVLGPVARGKGSGIRVGLR